METEEEEEEEIKKKRRNVIIKYRKCRIRKAYTAWS